VPSLRFCGQPPIMQIPLVRKCGAPDGAETARPLASLGNLRLSASPIPLALLAVPSTMQIFAGGVALPARLGALPRDFRAVAPVPVPVLLAKPGLPCVRALPAASAARAPALAGDLLFAASPLRSPAELHAALVHASSAASDLRRRAVIDERAVHAVRCGWRARAQDFRCCAEWWVPVCRTIGGLGSAVLDPIRPLAAHLSRPLALDRT